MFRNTTHVIYSLFDCMMSKEKENVDPRNPAPSKKPKLLLSRKGKGRFSSVSQDDLTSLTSSVCRSPKFLKIKKSPVSGRLTNLMDWFEDYNARNPDNPCPGEILTCECSKEVLNKWLSVFVNETQSKMASNTH